MKRVVLSLLCILSLLITPISGKAEGIVNHWPEAFTQSSDGKVTVSPKYVSVNEEMFKMVEGVTYYEVETGNPSFSSKDGVLYSLDGKKLIAYPGANTATTFTVPEGVETIDSWAFSGAKYLQKIVMASTVKEQKSYAFAECKALTSVVNNKKLRYVYEGAYKNCTNLTVSFPVGLEILEKTAMVGVKKYSIPASAIIQEQDLDFAWIIGKNKEKMPTLKSKKVKTKSSVVKGTGKASTKWYKKNKKKLYISTPDQLAGLAKLVENGTTFKGKEIVLKNDLDLKKYSNWNPIGSLDYAKEYNSEKLKKSFRGIFNGNHKTIYNLRVNRQQTIAAGLFGTIGVDGIVKKLNIKSASVLGYAYVGGVAGVCYGTIDRCIVDGQISGREYAGGIVGGTLLDGIDLSSRGYIKNCKNVAQVFAYSYTGGIAGKCYKMNQCTNTGTIKGYHDVKGIVGKTLDGLDKTWKKCKNKGKVKSLI